MGAPAPADVAHRAPAQPALTTNRTMDDDVARLRLQGHLARASAATAGRAITRALEAGAVRIELDLAGIGSVGPGGVAVLLQIADRLRIAGVDLRVVDRSPAIRRAIDDADATDRFELA